jgi:branched-chain amino acid transport system ATP-binding protein
MASALLSLDAVHCAYGPSRVLHGVSLEARAGEVVSLLGRNGAGKSTTLKSVVNLVEITAGAVRFDGRDITRLATHEISRLGIGYVPEDRRIFSDLTVEENLVVGAKGGGAWTTDRVHEFFPRLAELARRRAGSLSGGEQQMLALGRALMSRPKLVLLDEPSMGLAPVMVLRLFDLIRRVREEGYTILVVEQNVRQVLKLVDRAYLLEAGRLKMEGRADELSEQDFVRKAYVGL